MKRKLHPVQTSPVAVAVAVAMALAASPWAHAGSGSGGAVGGIIGVTPIVVEPGGRVIDGKVAMDVQGDFVAAWLSYSSSSEEIYAQRYLAPSASEGSAFLVSSVSGRNFLPSVAMDAAGDFVVAWENRPSSGSAEIYAQRYSSAGTPEGSALLVSTITGDNESPSVAMDAAGDFVVAWETVPSSGSAEVYAQRYSSAGTPEGSALAVSSTSGDNDIPSVAMDASGDFAVAWENVPSSGSDEIYVQRYSSAGAPEGSALAVSSTSGNNVTPAVAMDAAGDFVVAWENRPSSGSDEIYAQHYAAGATAGGGAFPVSSISLFGGSRSPSVAMDVEGDFVVAWESYGQPELPYKYEIDAQRYAPDGTPVGNPLIAVQRPIPAASNPANAVIALNLDPSVAMDGAGDFIIGESSKYATSSAYGSMISAQQYASEENLAATSVSITSSDPPGPEGSAFSLSFQVENQNVPSFRTPLALLNPFVGAVGDPTISITLPAQVATFPASGPDWICESTGGTSYSCTYEGWLAPGEYSPALMVSFIVPNAGTLNYSAQVVGSSQPPVTGSVSVAGATSGNSGGGGGMDWLSLLGLLGMGFLIRRHRRTTGRTSPA